MDFNKPVAFGIGYLGDGKYSYKGVGGKTCKVYSAWAGMFKRCYSEKYLKENPSYVGCSVAEVWHNLQVFAEWWENQYKEVGWCLDKDILVPNNKIYSPEFCSYVPQGVNKAIKLSHLKERDLPIGVVKNKNKLSHKYTAQIHRGSQSNKSLGVYETPEEASLVYCVEKELHIANIANRFKDVLREDVHEALINFKVSERV